MFNLVKENNDPLPGEQTLLRLPKGYGCDRNQGEPRIAMANLLNFLLIRGFVYALSPAQSDVFRKPFQMRRFTSGNRIGQGGL